MNSEQETASCGDYYYIKLFFWNSVLIAKVTVLASVRRLPADMEVGAFFFLKLQGKKHE